MAAQHRRALLTALAWLATRIPLYLMVTGHWLASYGAQSTGDVSLYHAWVQDFLNHGNIPTNTNWQYPPMVGPLLMLPQLMPGGAYLGQFIRLAFVADAAIFGILIWTASRRGSWLGPWFWIIGVPLLGPLIYGRFDVFATFFVIASLALLGRGVPNLAGRGRALNDRRWVAGALIGLGAAIKVWPGLALFGLPRTRRGAQTAIAALATGGLTTLVCTIWFNGGLSFLHAQGGRGIEVESVWAMPFLLATHFGFAHVRVQERYGSWEVIGSGVDLTAGIALFFTVIGFALLGWWWWRKAWRPAIVADATFVGTLIMIVTSRVISPQYMIWLLGTAAFCLLFKDTTQRRSTLLFLISLPLTQVDFPYAFWGLRHEHLVPILVVTLRDALLVAATVIGLLDLWRSTVTGRFWPQRTKREIDVDIDLDIEEVGIGVGPDEPAESPAPRPVHAAEEDPLPAPSAV
jgi:hypothetical protein